MSKLLVGTGAYNLKSVEIVNLDQSTSDIFCENLPDLPIDLFGASGFLLRGSVPIICGGSYEGKVQCDCHAYENGVWNTISSLNECRGASGFVSFSSTLDDDDDVLFIAGGSNEGKLLSTVETFDGNDWSQELFSDLTEPVMLQCLVKINDSMLMQIGGTLDNNPSGATSTTYFFNTIENIWSAGPKLSSPRFGHSCGVAYWKNPRTGVEENVVVVAGGFYNNGAVLSSVELLFLDSDDGWERGPALPLTTAYGQMVEFDNSVILIGGMGMSPEMDGQHLYQLSSAEGSWIEMSQTLNEKRIEHVAFLIPDELVICH